MLELRILGRLQVVVDGHERAAGPAANRRVLVRLALAGAAGLSVDRLQEDLGITATALRTAVSRLRKAIGPAIVTLESGYRLDGVRLDADAFDHSVERAAALDLEERIVALDEALALWRGRALDGVEDEAWAQPVAERLEERRVDARVARATAKLDLGRHADAIAEARAVVAEHPLREPPRAVLMRALAAAGRSTEALRAYQDFRALLVEEVGTEPSATLRALDTDIATGTVGPLGDRNATAAAEVRPPQPSAGALPITSTSFVGRQREHGAVLAELATSRLVTLVGVAGVGKTRLAVEVARAAAMTWPVDVRFVDLTRATHDDDVLDVVRVALGLDAPPGSLDQLVDVVADDRALLVLDNCEHVIGAAATLVERVAARCAGISVLATSREALGVPGERMVAVAPLAAAGDAITLFTDRARAVDAAFALDDATLPAVEAICATLDGIPLAIELAAARARSLSVRDIADRLDDRFRLLSGVRRTSVDRHRTLAAAVDWSYQLLSPAEQRVLGRLGVFARRFSLADAEAMLDDPDAHVALLALVDKSLVTRDGSSHYRLLETIRHYALDKLAETGELDDARAEHLAHVRREVRTAVAAVDGADAGAGATRVLELFPELRAAVQWAASTDRVDLAVDLCAAIEPVFLLDLDLGVLAAEVLAHADATRHPGSLVVEGFALFDRFLRGHPEAAERTSALIERHLAGEPSLIVSYFGPQTLAYQGDAEAAISAAHRIRDRWIDAPRGVDRLWGVGAAFHLTGDPAQLGPWREALDDARRRGSAFWVVLTSSYVARGIATSDPGLARELVIESLRRSAEVDLPLIAQNSLVTYVLLLDLDREGGVIDARVRDVVLREIERSRRGYRLRAQHYLVLGALLTIAGRHELAVEALAAHDLLATPTSARTRALVAVVRADLDERLARAGAPSAPALAATDLPALVARIEESLATARR